MEIKVSYSVVCKIVSIFVALALLLANVPAPEPLNVLSNTEAADLSALSNPSSPSVIPSTGIGASLSRSVTAIAAGSGHTCALTSSGGVKCWGAQRRRSTRRRHEDAPPDVG